MTAQEAKQRSREISEVKIIQQIILVENAVEKGINIGVLYMTIDIELIHDVKIHFQDLGYGVITGKDKFIISWN